jgi:5-methylthioadenosine/S-adenosylhomocysteine deaminase
MDNVGLLGPRLNIVHSVWISRREIDHMAAADAGIVLNQLSNFKLKSGIAPIYDMRQAGVRLGAGLRQLNNKFQLLRVDAAAPLEEG